MGRFQIKLKNMKSKMNRDQLINYLIETRDSNKGVIIMGNYGVGKTLITQYLTPSTYNKPGQVNRIYSDMLTKIAGKNMDIIGALMNDHYFKNTLYLLDDVGSENNINSYGVELNYVKEYIYEAYNNYARGHKNRLVATTNLNSKQLSDKYGERVLDRIEEFCDIILLEDTNIRSLNDQEYVNGLKQRLKDLHEQYFNQRNKNK